MNPVVLIGKWKEERSKLKDYLDTIPFTQTQRKYIELYLNDLEFLFTEANL